MASPDNIAVRVLGDVQIAGSTKPLPPRQQLLLGVLAVRAKPLSLDTLTDLLWPTSPPENPRAALQIHVSRLRRLLDQSGATIKREGDGYTLVIEPHGVDVREFDRLVTEGMALMGQDAAAGMQRIASALELWQGPPPALLTECSLLRGELSRLDELRAWALEARIQGDISLGRPSDVIAELRSLVVEYPLREGFTRLLVLALASAGRFTEALESYENTRRILADELDAHPGAELEEAHQQLLEAIAAASVVKSADQRPGAPSVPHPLDAVGLARQALLQPAADDTARGLDYVALADAIRAVNGPSDEADDAVTRALELIPDTPTVARARALVAHAWSWRTAPEQAAESADHAIELTELTGSAELLAHALQRGGAAEAMLGGIDVGRELVLRGRFIAEQAGYQQGVLDSFCVLADVQILAGHPGDSADTALAGLARAPDGAPQHDTLTGLALSGLTWSGRWDEARQLEQTISDSDTHPVQLGSALVRFWALCGDLPRAQEELEQLTENFGKQDARVGLCESWLALCREDWHGLHSAATRALRNARHLAAAEVNELVFLCLVALTERKRGARRSAPVRNDAARLLQKLQPDPGGMHTVGLWAELARAEAQSHSWTAVEAWTAALHAWSAVDGWAPVRDHITRRLATASGLGAHVTDLLTPREREVLEHVADGASNRIIAAHFGISEKTASVHVSNLLQKFEVTSRTELALRASRNDSADASA